VLCQTPSPRMIDDVRLRNLGSDYRINIPHAYSKLQIGVVLIILHKCGHGVFEICLYLTFT
jgi:hypothetical protein